MDKSPDAFRTISEVAEWLGVQAHVLRFWESKFTHVKPVKRAGGRRYYRPGDMQLLGGIKNLLHDEGLTIKGVQKILREQGAAHVSSLSQDLCDVAADAVRVDGTEAKVLPFKGARTAPGDDPQPVQIDHVGDAAESPSEPAGSGDQTSAAPATTAAPIVTPPVPEPEPEPEKTASRPPADEPEKPVLPSFLHRPARAPAPTVAAKPSLVVDAPDPAAEADLPYARGPLAELAALESLNAAQVKQIAPLVQQLQAWLARAETAGAA